ncbi:MAG: SUMF1/EgtB/PvdO family nonheme iron enzyme [Anaerolineales bacterium]|nr:SUMF1/EgtB/PvdO family nonheme iron enzyme [Anaerolineales bacterium]
MENLTGQHIDRYELLELLGKGGMAMVYKAYDSRLEREVAIKIIRQDAFPPEILQDVLKRFEREAKSLARLSHPNIVKVLDYGEYEGSPFLVLEFYAGGTLKEKIGDPISWREALRLLLPVARGVEYAHQRDIIHRDIKPANILMADNGEPTLSDFGIAKIFQNEKNTALTGSGMAMGTPEYMAPEQWTGQTGHQSDMYSLGIILYELVTGRRPYIADTPGAVFLKQVTEPLPYPSGVVPNLPEAVEQLLIKALARDPGSRFANLGELIREIENLLNADEGKLKASESRPASNKAEAVPIPVGSSPARASSLRMLVVGGIGGVMVIIAALVVGVPFILGKLNPSPTATPIAPTEAPTSAPAPTQTLVVGSGPLLNEITDARGAEMVLVPEGMFTMGSKAEDALAECLKYQSDCDLSWYRDEEPPHTVFLDSFYIDRYEVTNGQYAVCVDEGTCQPPTSSESAIRSSYYGNPEYENYPVIYVSWDMAKAFCEWRGARLPSEAEWEKAARGPEGNVFPWGAEADLTYANYNVDIGDTVAVGRYENGQSPYGAYDMAGNVWEWVADWYSNSYYQVSPLENPLGPETGEKRILRGGSWYDPAYLIRTSIRLVEPVPVDNNFGIRCARTAP